MKELFVLNNITSFNVEKGIIALIENRRTIRILDQFFQSNFLHDIGENLQEVKISGKYIWANTSMEGKSVLYHDDRIFTYDFFITTIRDEFFYINLNGEDKKLEGPDKVIWVILDGLFTYCISNPYLIYKRKKYEIVLLDDLTGKYLWTYTLPESKYDWKSGGPYPQNYKGELRNIIGVYGNIIWTVLNSGRLLGLDVKSGSCIYDLLFPNQSDEDFTVNKDVFLYGLHTKLDENRGLLFGIFYHYYWEIDLRNPNKKYVYYDIKNTCEQHKIDYNALKYQCHIGDEVFFAQQEFAQDPSYVGIFNRNIREITWTSRELGDEGVFKGINKVDYSENRLYVLDRANTLHIFER